MEITDKNSVSLIRSDFYTFIPLLDSEGQYITGVGVGKNPVTGDIQIAFPGGAIDVDSVHHRPETVAIRLSEVKKL